MAAYRFMGQLERLVPDIFKRLCDASKKQVKHTLVKCMEAPSGAGVPQGQGHGREQGQGQALQLASDWTDLLLALELLLQLAKQTHLPRVLTQRLFEQLFSYADVKMFNHLLHHWECCTMERSRHLEAGLAQVGGTCLVAAQSVPCCRPHGWLPRAKAATAGPAVCLAG
jgi:hypothetical protein